MNLRLTLLASLAASGAASLLSAADIQAQNAPTNWVSELSATAKVGTDTNVYGVDNQRATDALLNRSATVYSIAFKFTGSVSQLLGGNKDALVVGYAPTETWYTRLSTENNLQHRFTVQSSGKDGDVSWSLDNSTTFIDGTKNSLHFNNYNIFGMGQGRDRRAQMQDAGKAWVRYNVGPAFARFVASTNVIDIHTNLRNPTGTNAGWLNWVDRRDFNVGVDLGYAVTKDVSLIVGDRLGDQHHGATVYAPKNSANHYNRVVVGVEGKPAKWLSLALLTGPDYRSYSATNQYVTTRTQTAYYYDGSATVTINASNSITVAAKQERWLSSTGQAAYDSKAISAGWKSKFSSALSGALTVTHTQGKYVSPSIRNDIGRNLTAALTWTLSKQLALTLDGSLIAGEDLIGTTATFGRGYHRNLVNLSAKYTF